MRDNVLAVEMTKINYVLVCFLQKFPIKTRSKIYINSYQESTPEERYKLTALEKKGKKFTFHHRDVRPLEDLGRWLPFSKLDFHRLKGLKKRHHREKNRSKILRLWNLPQYWRILCTSFLIKMNHTGWGFPTVPWGQWQALHSGSKITVSVIRQI